ncbi:AzlC family ABC transporter permease [Saccharomonospora azurea]|uniref:Branched-chain amino acid permease (Azaleucine resistance) n=1 Tax=Saccharomonospora azurea NA-128 TaxID=882081 RepID=H8G9Z3_9PSEU|nr:AzlC family ABC transporter permease [Saccharomonospora azurea]EHY87549.1 putative branched-chain amino acid permease (azaleucine resistance) [Saccharomonospora azurea NA-128]
MRTRRAEIGFAARTTSHARNAFRDSAAVGLGYLPLGIALGVLVIQSGLDWWWAILSPAVVYAGSFELVLIGLVAAAAPLTVVAGTAFIINTRHAFYALSFPLHQVNGRLGKLYSTFALSDEAYALTSTNEARSWHSRRILWLQFFLHFYWVTGATTGALLGGAQVFDGIRGLDFALTALFTVLALDALRNLDGELFTPALAVFSAVIARILFPGQLLLAAVSLLTAGLLARHVTTRKRHSRD